MKKIVIFASGTGSNAKAIIDFTHIDRSYEVVGLICDRPNAGVIRIAQENNIKTFVYEKTKGMTKLDHEKFILSALDSISFDLIVLAGYMRLFSANFLEQFPPRTIVNIHPSLLPAFKGANSYQDAFDANVKKSGITIHYVEEEMDSGEIIEQHSFDRQEKDTVETFKARGLALEHSHYPKVIKNILSTSCSYRVEVYPKNVDLIKNKERVSIKVFLIETNGPFAQLKKIANDILIDPVVEMIALYSDSDIYKSILIEESHAVDIYYLPGVTDNTAHSAKDAILKHPEIKRRTYFSMELYTGELVFVKTENIQNLSDILYKDFANSWLQSAKVLSCQELKKHSRFNRVEIPKVKLVETEVKYIDLSVEDDELVRLSEKHLWALTLPELKFAQSYFKSENRMPSDVEMEIIAQTWSEHCKHKIFASEIEHTDHEGTRTIKSLFKTFIKGSTSKIIKDRKIDWARSVFTDNAGIVRWDEKLDVCIKVETHNSPSALDPYGGALTGILGVNRDILGCGFGARPIANTDVFCLPPVEADTNNWPTELHSPTRLRLGVHKGVQDGGNKSGIPTVNGAFHYDMCYAGKPLVYCGTIGVLPHKIGETSSHEKNQTVGDYVVMVGGRIGKDGIHGATFSSLELQEGTPSTVVQIGDPLTQKRVMDFLLKARDLQLYTSITDNGAGGISSSVGEMAQGTNGAIIDLKKAPLKYPGLAPYEIMISESQERMTCAVSKNKINEFMDLSKKFGVESTVLGEFTNDGQLKVMFGDNVVAQLSLAFLFEDLPPMKLKSSWTPNYPRENWKKINNKSVHATTVEEKLKLLLSSPNIRSHENWVRQYDHEVQAASVTKPFTTNGAPTNAGVIAMKPHGGGEKNGIVIASGIAPQVSRFDTKLMAKYAIDEAVRNAIVTGADPAKMVLIDNFCWPDPLPGKNNPDFAQKLGELVRACEGLYEVSTTFGMPFVSGKDSMKNDAIVQYQNQRTKISVLPTLLITSMAHLPDVNHVCNSLFKIDEDIWLIGKNGIGASLTLNQIIDGKMNGWDNDCKDVESTKLIKRYELFHELWNKKIISAAHDVSEGGLLVTLSEVCFANGLGIKIDNLDENVLFGEGLGVIAFSASTDKRVEIKNAFKKLNDEVDLIGTVVSDYHLTIMNQKIKISELKKSFEAALCQ